MFRWFSYVVQNTHQKKIAMFAKFRWHVSKTQPILAVQLLVCQILRSTWCTRRCTCVAEDNFWISRLELSLKTIIENSGVVSAPYAAKDVKYLDHRHLLMQSFKGNLHHSQYLKKNMVEKISGSGLSFVDLKMVYSKYGKEGLIAILSKPPTSSSSASPRVSNTPRKNWKPKHKPYFNSTHAGKSLRGKTLREFI